MLCLAHAKLELPRLRERSVISVITCRFRFKWQPDETLSNPLLDSRCASGRLSRTSHAQFCSDGNAGTHISFSRFPYCSNEKNRSYQASCLSPVSLQFRHASISFANTFLLSASTVSPIPRSLLRLSKTNEHGGPVQSRPRQRRRRP